jgi:hypothetical protein
MSDIPDRPDPDFSVAGQFVADWLGLEVHEATIKAAEQAIAVPTEAVRVAVFHEPTLPADQFGAQQRRALKIWVKKAHPDLPGRVRLNVRHRLEPDSGQDVRSVEVTYDPKPRVAKVAAKLDEIHGLSDG